jgi:uncharacterized protein
MLLAVREMELHPVRFDVRIKPGVIEFEDELRQASPIVSQGEAVLLSDMLGEIRVMGSLEVDMEAPCDRCLELASYPIRTRFDLLYQPNSPEFAPEEHLAKDEIEIGFYDGDGLELDDILLEQIVLALPMQKVCKPDCKGICPTCGQNRNLAVCTCQVRPSDDRWAALQSLKK